MPFYRREVLVEGYKDANERIKSLVAKYSVNVAVQPTEMIVNSKGQLVSETSHYSEESNIIYMEDNIDNDSYADAYRHEFGHYIDAQLARPSLTENFTYAMQADRDVLLFVDDRGERNLDNMLNELVNCNALDNMYISDILSAQFFDEQEVMERILETYYDNNAAFYGHEKKYWEGVDAPKQAVNRETFAELFALYSENDKESVSFVEKWFPNTTKRFWKEVSV